MISQTHVAIPINKVTVLWKADVKTNLLLRASYYSNANIYIGNEKVTLLTGLGVIPNTYIPIILDKGDVLYAISDALGLVEILVQS